MMCVTTQPDSESFQQERVLANNPTGATVCANRKVTYRDFTDVSNSIANLALTLPDEDARVECLGMLVQMRHSLSISAAGGHQASVPLSQFMSSAEEFLRAFGPNAESRRDGVFLADHSNGSFEMQRHNSYRQGATEVTYITE